MPFVNGVFQRVYNWVNDKNANIDITASRFDTEDDGFATGLSTAILKDGTQTLTANIPFASFKITGLGAGSARTDSLNLGQEQDGVLNWVAAAGTADAITAGYSPAVTALVDGQICWFRATAANATTTPTFSPNGLTARTITKFGGIPLAPGDIAGNLSEVALRYNLANTRWELVNPTTPLNWAVAAGTADAITATYSPAIPSLTDGLLCFFRASAANATTTPTFAPNGLTAHTITKRGGAALSIGDIPGADAEIILRYKLASTRWELLNPIWAPTAPLTNSLAGSNLALNNTSNYFTGPTVAQGTTGTFLAFGSVTVRDNAGSASISAKLWDGTTVIDAANSQTVGAGLNMTIALSGFITSPAGNIRISAQDGSSTSGLMIYNDTGTGKDSTLTVVRIA